jgi:ribosomal protein S8
MKQISLYDIGRWYENQGLVGEKSLALTQTIVAISGKPMGFGLEAPAGSGKSVTMDLLVGDEDTNSGLIDNKYIYFKDAGSETSFFRDAEAINKKRIIVFKELQKDKTHMTIEAIKSMTEGKNANRRVTDITKDKVVNQQIEPKTVMYTLAIENDTKPDPELRRRCITMATDVSKEQTSEVLGIKSMLRWDKESIKIMEDNESEEIKRFVNDFLKMQFKVANPYAHIFAKTVEGVAPDQKVRSMIEHFYNVMEGVTKLNSAGGNRVVVEGDKLICNIQDLYQTLDIYKQSFLRDVYSIPPLGDIILQGFNDVAKVDATDKGPSSSSLNQFISTATTGTWVDIEHLRKAIKAEQKVVLAKNVVIQICRQLVDAGYLEDWRDGQTTKYQIQEEYKEFGKIDAKEFIKEAATLVKKKYPQVFDRWRSMQETSYIHPIDGHSVDIVKSVLDELDEDII